jgi:integrase/recombinase XerD
MTATSSLTSGMDSFSSSLPIPTTGTLSSSEGMNFASLIARFLGSHDVSQSSKGTYKRQLVQFQGWLTETGRIGQLTSLRREDILAYKTYLMDSAGLTAHSVSGYLVAVRRLFAWLESERIFPNIARDIKGPKKPKNFRRDCLTVVQIREALGALKGEETIEDLRDFALVNLLVRTGLRTIEVSKATIGDLRQESGEAVLWVQGKGRSSKDDFVLLVDDTLGPIRKYLQARGPATEDEPLFASVSDRNAGEPLATRSISRIVKDTLRSIGLDDRRLTAHSLRHTAVTLAIRGGASLQQAQAMARHTDPKTTMIYFHNLDRVAAGAERFIEI